MWDIFIRKLIFYRYVWMPVFLTEVVIDVVGVISILFIDGWFSSACTSETKFYNFSFVEMEAIYWHVQIYK